ncbi:MAG: nitroreductase family protein [Verrucomicrobia bacterium]|nr:nitroreductase family protein [Verrucomicrobiota bacterium]
MEKRAQRIQTIKEGRSHRDLSEVIQERRATNHFTDEEIPTADLSKILHFAGQAPSGYNLQPWRFVVVQKSENRKRLQAVAFDQEKVSEASAVVIFIGARQQTQDSAKKIFEDGNRRGLGKPENNDQIIKGAMDFISGSVGWQPWLNRHTMIAFSFAMLMAESLGYDTAPMEGFDPAAVKREFKIPEDAEVVALLAIGRAKPPEKKYPGRLALNEIAFSETYGQPWTGEEI